jgi:hypothetical protein
MNNHLKSIIDRAILSYVNKIEMTTLSGTSQSLIQQHSSRHFTPEPVQSLGNISLLTTQINKQVPLEFCIEINVSSTNDELSPAFSECLNSRSKTRQLEASETKMGSSVEMKPPSSFVLNEPKDDRTSDFREFIPALKLKSSLGLLEMNGQFNPYGSLQISQCDAFQRLKKLDHSSFKKLYSPILDYQHPYSIQSYPSHNSKLQASIGIGYQGLPQTARLSRNLEGATPEETTKVSISHQELYRPSMKSKFDTHEKGSNGMKYSSIMLYTDKDDKMLSPYQCLIRKQIEIFTAGRIDVESTAQGRNSPIRFGQVGIRCRHCSMLPPQHRTKASTYYPSKLLGIYQAAQNIAVTHLSGQCPLIPDKIREELIQLHSLNKATPGRGKVYWANSVQVFGLYESDGMIVLDTNKILNV